MIRPTRRNGGELFLNADLIATVESHPDTVVTTVESHPDTVVTTVDSTRYVVVEPADEVVAAVTAYRASVVALAESIDRKARGAGAGDEQRGRLYMLRPWGDSRRVGSIPGQNAPEASPRAAERPHPPARADRT